MITEMDFSTGRSSSSLITVARRGLRVLSAELSLASKQSATRFGCSKRGARFRRRRRLSRRILSIYSPRATEGRRGQLFQRQTSPTCNPRMPWGATGWFASVGRPRTSRRALVFATENRSMRLPCGSRRTRARRGRAERSLARVMTRRRADGHNLRLADPAVELGAWRHPRLITRLRRIVVESP
jgi:hypothetical protein